MLANIVLYILYFDKKSLRYKILSLNSSSIDSPSLTINSENNIQELLNNIISKYIDISPGYIDCKLSDVEIDQNRLNIYYYCLVPFSVNYKNLSPIDINLNEVYPKNLYKIIRNL
jgi:hypothetical protein